MSRDLLTFSARQGIAVGLGQGGSVYTFGPGETLVTNHNASTPITVTKDGVTYTAATIGTTTSRYQRSNGSVTDRYTARVGDRTQWGYSCAASELDLCRNSGLTRVTPSRVSPAPSGVPPALPSELARNCAR